MKINWWIIWQLYFEIRLVSKNFVFETGWLQVIFYYIPNNSIWMICMNGYNCWIINSHTFAISPFVAPINQRKIHLQIQNILNQSKWLLLIITAIMTSFFKLICRIQHYQLMPCVLIANTQLTSNNFVHTLHIKTYLFFPNLNEVLT